MFTLSELLDSGSQISAMTDDFLARLGLPKRRFQSSVVGLAQSPVAQIHGVTQCQFSSHFDSEYVFPTVDLVILSQITSAMPSRYLLVCAVGINIFYLPIRILTFLHGSTFCLAQTFSLVLSVHMPVLNIIQVFHRLWIPKSAG